MRRFLAWLCSLSLIFCVASGVAHGVEIPNIEDMDIDPWADFETISQFIGGAQISPAQLEDDTYTIDDDAGIMPLVDQSEFTWSLHWSGFAGYGYWGSDEDTEWVGVPVYSDAEFSQAIRTGIVSPSFNGTTKVVLTPTNRPSPVQSKIPISNSACYVGRPPLIGGDPNVSYDTHPQFNAGVLRFDVTNWEEAKAVSSLQLIDVGFNFGVMYGGFSDIEQSRPTFGVGNIIDYRNMEGGKLLEVHLIVNGKDMGPIDCTMETREVDRCFWHYAHIDDAIVKFDEQMVYSVGFELVVGRAWADTYEEFTGGFAVQLFNARYTSSAGAYVSNTARIVSGGDDNSGLLSSIIEWLQGIIQAITELPGKIATAIIDGIKSLFIPDEDFLAQWKEEFFTMLKTKFGFIYECFEFLGNFFSDFILTWGNTEEYVFHFPGIEIPIHGETYVLVPEQDIPMQNGLVDIIRPFAGTVISIVVVLATISTLEDVFIAIISGYGYFQFIMSKREEAEDDIKEWEDELK